MGGQAGWTVGAGDPDPDNEKLVTAAVAPTLYAAGRSVPGASLVPHPSVTDTPVVSMDSEE